MNINAVADQVLGYLATKYSRVYRNKPPLNPTFPYIIYKVDTVLDTVPSKDIYLIINIFEKAEASVRVIESLADSIDDGLEQKVINTSTMCLHFGLEQRQPVSADELTSAQVVNLRYVIRGYFS
ncbi:hypothetical protein [Acetobacterium sp.]|uniref:hypothetical protein n=1 Tax=Acetobacterium sp. TaxID=1872094 RepID=UPI002F40D453